MVAVIRRMFKKCAWKDCQLHAEHEVYDRDDMLDDAYCYGHSIRRVNYLNALEVAESMQNTELAPLFKLPRELVESSGDQ